MTTTLLAALILAPAAAVLAVTARPARDYWRALRTPEHDDTTPNTATSSTSRER